MKRLSKISFPVLTMLSCLLLKACTKEYSCEACQSCRIDTAINIKDTAWRFNIGNELYYGDLRFSVFTFDKHGFTFYGYSLHSPGAIFNLGFVTSTVSFDHDIYNLAIDSITINYGSNGTTTQTILGLNNIDNFKPRYMKGIIKTFDTSSHIVEGYFCGTALDDNRNLVNITNGRFRVRIN